MKIAVFLPECPWGELDENAMNAGLGGRETALVQLAVNWARLGHEVYAFVPREEMATSLYEMPDGGPPTFVKWIPMQRVISIAPVLDLDLFVSWENAEVFEQLGRHDVGFRVIHMQVAHLNATDEQMRRVNQIAALSPWARDFLKTQVPQWAEVDERWKIFPNGIDLSRFVWDRDDMGEKFEFVYSSSPDRGLHHLLIMWDAIRSTIRQQFNKEAHLHICYGAEKFVAHSRWSHRVDSERALVIERALSTPDSTITYHGKVGQDFLARLMTECDGLLYPFDPMSPTETGCITIVEALAAGTPVVTTDGDCLGEQFGELTYQTELPLNYDNYIAKIMEMLDERHNVIGGDFSIINAIRKERKARDEARRQFVLSRDWTVIAQDWIDYYSNLSSTMVERFDAVGS